MNIAIYSRHLKPSDVQPVQELFEQLHAHQLLPHVYGPYFESMQGAIDFPGSVTVFETYDDLVLQDIKLMISLGGDGTILDTTTFVRDSGIPIMGINLGRLGFLASIQKNVISKAIESFVSGAYVLDERTLLHLDSNLPLFAETPFALNDLTLLKRDTSSMITVHTFINGEFLNSYWADGIIMATPTGSTGYSLSCGGPIIFPNSGNFVITPVAPHNLNVRPIVISDDSVVSFEVEGRARHFLCTLDSRYEQIDATHQIAIRKEDFSIYLVRLHGGNFLNTLREKLAWGLDKRN